jgi:hypothetical protein
MLYNFLNGKRNSISGGPPGSSADLVAGGSQLSADSWGMSGGGSGADLISRNRPSFSFPSDLMFAAASGATHAYPPGVPGVPAVSSSSGVRPSAFTGISASKTTPKEDAASKGKKRKSTVTKKKKKKKKRDGDGDGEQETSDTPFAGEGGTRQQSSSNNDNARAAAAAAAAMYGNTAALQHQYQSLLGAPRFSMSGTTAHPPSNVGASGSELLNERRRSSFSLAHYFDLQHNSFAPLVGRRDSLGVLSLGESDASNNNMNNNNTVKGSGAKSSSHGTLSVSHSNMSSHSTSSGGHKFDDELLAMMAAAHANGDGNDNNSNGNSATSFLQQRRRSVQLLGGLFDHRPSIDHRLLGFPSHHHQPTHHLDFNNNSHANQAHYQSKLDAAAFQQYHQQQQHQQQQHSLFGHSASFHDSRNGSSSSGLAFAHLPTAHDLSTYAAAQQQQQHKYHESQLLAREEATLKEKKTKKKKATSTKTETTAKRIKTKTEGATQAGSKAKRTDRRPQKDKTKSGATKPPRTKALSSAFRGVSRCSKDGRWQARIRVGANVKYLGRFKTQEQAAMCYDKAAVIHHGDRAVLNYNLDGTRANVEVAAQQAKAGSLEVSSRAAMAAIESANNAKREGIALAGLVSMPASTSATA